MTITLEMDAPGTFGCPVIRAEDGRDILVQSDWDWAGLASSFGWVPCCGSGETDGTVNCRNCGAKVGTMLEAARAYLEEHDGDEIEDPGYFA